MNKEKDKYEIVSKFEVDKFLHELKPVLGRLNEYINKESPDCVFRREIVGSTARGVVTRVRGGNQGFDIDINLVIRRPKEGKKYIGKIVHDLYLDGLRKAVAGTAFSPPEESTSVFTIKNIDKENSKILHSADLAIIYYDSTGDLHFLQYNKSNGGFGFQIRHLPKDVDGMIEAIKQNHDNGDELIADTYMRKKNSNRDPGKHSFILYTEAVSDLYNQIIT